MKRKSVDLYLSDELQAAIVASGESRQGLAREIAPVVGCAVNTAKALLTRGHRVPHNGHGNNSIIAALCAHLGFPVEHALTATLPGARGSASDPLIERRYRAALARVKAQRMRLTEEDCNARRGSPFGRPDIDVDEAA